MALLFADGFDHYGTDATLPAGYWNTWTSTGASLVTGLLGVGKAMRTTTQSQCEKDLATNAATLIVGFCINITTLPATAITLLGLVDVNLLQVCISLQPNGALIISKTPTGTTPIATTTNVLTVGVRYHIEFKITVHNTAGAYELRVNGSSVGWFPATTGVNTRQSLNNYANKIRHRTTGQGTGGDLSIDDLYVLDTSGSRLNDFLGDCKINTSFPNSNGSTIQWTPTAGNNYEITDNNPPVDASYVSDATAGHRDLYDFTDISSGNIHAAILLHRAAKSDAGTKSIQPVCKSGATTNVGTAQGLSTTFLWYPKTYENDPNTSAQWTRTNLNSAEFGQDVA